MRNNQHKLLIVDDDARICKLIARTAVKSGVKVMSLTDPSAFHPTIDSFKPTIVFLDLNMPEIDGIQILMSLKEAKVTPQIYIMSGVDPAILASTYRLAVKNGVKISGLLTKPLDWLRITKILSSPDTPPHANTDVKSKAPVATVDSTLNEIKISKFDVSQGIHQSQFFMDYQPKIALDSGKVIGVEALARWVHPDMGNIPPTVFIPFAEENDLIWHLTYSLITYAIFDFRLLQKTLGDFKLAINISVKLLEDSQLPEKLTDLFETAGIPTKKVILEITETLDTDETILSMEILSRFRIKGFNLSIDDFGTGYASLSKLLTYPFTELKIDKQFTMGIKNDKDSRIILESTIDMAKRFNLDIVAEGIEDSETLRWLIDKGCSEGQGYYLCPPMSPIKLIQWYQDNMLKSNLIHADSRLNLDAAEMSTYLQSHY